MERVMAKYDIIRRILSKVSSRQVLVGCKIRRLGSQVLSRLCRQFEGFTPRSDPSLYPFAPKSRWPRPESSRLVFNENPEYGPQSQTNSASVDCRDQTLSVNLTTGYPSLVAAVIRVVTQRSSPVGTLITAAKETKVTQAL